MMHFLLLQKLARVPLKNCFWLAIIIPGKCKYISGALANIFFKSFLRFPAGSPWLSLAILGYPWLSLVILSYPWLSLVIPGYPWLYLVIPVYPWLYLVILGYTWLSLVIPGYPWLYPVIYDSHTYMWNRLRICNYLSRHLQKSSAVAAR